MRNSVRQVGIHPSFHLAINMANTEAWQTGSELIEPSHFLLAALKIIDDNFDQAAEKLNLSDDALKAVAAVVTQCREMLEMTDDEITAARRNLRQALEKEHAPTPFRLLPRSNEFNYLFHRATRRMVRAGAEALNLAHMFEVMLTSPPVEAAPFLKVAATEKLDSLAAHDPAEGSFSIVDLDEPTSAASASVPVSSAAREAAPVVRRTGRDLSALAREHRLSPIVGRRAEMTTLARYLQRTSKRNVIITGATGVGKTTLVEGLARELTAEKVPDFLRALRIVQIQATDFLTATKSIEEMEQHALSVLREMTADPNTILFFDEIHLVVAPDAAGALPPNLINIIKPVLLDGEQRCVGTASHAEFERYLKRDTALMRQFQVLPLEELPEDEIVQICREWARRIESVQQVKFEDDAILAAVTLTAQLIQESALPSKAIDLLENAATFVKVTSLSFTEQPSGADNSRIRREDIVQILKEQYGLTKS